LAMKLPIHLCIAVAIAAAFSPLPDARAFSSKIPSKQNAKVATSSDDDTKSDGFIFRKFSHSECDDNNQPPSLRTIIGNIQELTSQGSDIRGRFVDHPRLGRISQVAKVIEQNTQGGVPALTPFTAFCLGNAFAKIVLDQKQQPDQDDTTAAATTTTTIALGRDPRIHGAILCDSFARGAAIAHPNIRVVYTGLATSPSMFHFCRAGMCDGAVMVTASHLPSDRNGLKMYTFRGGFTKSTVRAMNHLAANFARQWHDSENGMLPPTSGGEGVFCSEWVDFMPEYIQTLKDAICKEVNQAPQRIPTKPPLDGLKIVLNSGNGSGGFFYDVLQDLGADVSASVHIEPNPQFPSGIPNPEKKEMIAETIQICQESGADLGILLDTDADRSGFVVPSDKTKTSFEPLNRNRLIALLSVVFSRSSPGCTIVTDSVTSEGLADFINALGLIHYRYLKGYANVIGKAEQLNEQDGTNAEMAIETSGHCAMKENAFLDDGTYTAVKVIGLLAREKLADAHGQPDLLSLIAAMKEMEEEVEIRMEAKDGSLETTNNVFNLAVKVIEDSCGNSSLPWTLDTENLEGIRVRTGFGGFFMLRKSLHDPLVSLQIESTSKDEAKKAVVAPLLETFRSIKTICSALDMRALLDYRSE